LVLKISAIFKINIDAENAMGDSDFVTIAIQNVTLNERDYEFKLRAVHSLR